MRGAFSIGSRSMMMWDVEGADPVDIGIQADFILWFGDVEMHLDALQARLDVLIGSMTKEEADLLESSQ